MGTKIKPSNLAPQVETRITNLATANSLDSSEVIGLVNSDYVKGFVDSDHVSLKIGYTPLNKSGDTMTGQLKLGSISNSPTDVKLQTEGGIKLVTPNNSTSRVYALNNTSSSYTLNVTGGAAVAFISDGSNNQSIAFETHLSGNWHREQMRIDPYGRVTMPYQPAFFVGQNSLGTSAAGSTVAFNSVFLNVGSHFSTSTNRFTAPIDGVYHFYFYSFLENDNTVSSEVQLYKNGGSISIRNYTSDMASSYGPPVTFQATLNLIANDYMTVFTGLRLHANLGSYFGGYLIG